MFLDPPKRRFEAARLKAWYAKHERSLVSGFLVAGFLLDVFTFRALSVGTTLIGLGIYLAIMAGSILFVFLFDARTGSWRHPFWQRLRVMVPLVAQLAVGSLLSMALLFYWFSGAISVSWPIFSVLLILMISNETFRTAYLRPTIQIGLFSFLLFSYLLVVFPYAFNSLAIWTVLLASGLSIGLSALLIFGLVRVAPNLKKRTKHMGIVVGLVLASMNALYFLDLIPPIPLSLREAGVYHNVKRVGKDYQLTGEPENIWQSLWPGQTVHGDAASRIYAFSTVYTPADLNVMIYHHWELYDEAQKKWISQDRLAFPITGARAEGYRGFTYKTHLKFGKWRVTVETGRGQVLGRMRFNFVATPVAPTVPAPQKQATSTEMLPAFVTSSHSAVSSTEKEVPKAPVAHMD